MCDDGNDQIVDGLIEITIVSFEGDILTSEFLLGMDAVFTDVMLIESGETTTLNGDIGTTIDTRSPPVAEVSILVDSFTVSSIGKTESISNYSLIYTEDSSEFPATWTLNAMGTVGSSEFTGVVTYETPVSFEGAGENYPHTGELLVTDANKATLRLITIDEVNVQIDADYNADGIIDETLYKTWVELEG